MPALSNSKSIDVFLLPTLFQPQQLAGKTAVVFDVLRATTVMVEALANGAQQIIACETIPDALARRTEIEQFAQRHPNATSNTKVLMCGERQGLRIEGFDLGNSPFEFPATVISGKTLVMTTTNGTKAIVHSHLANEILIGAFVNLSALVNELHSHHDIALVCAGTGGEITGEDVLAAGAVVDRLASTGKFTSLNDQAEIARACWKQFELGQQSLSERLRQCRGGQNLLAHRFERDIKRSAEVDRHSVVPTVNKQNQITLEPDRRLVKPVH
jgi:2-phosphosulfolactate phosphatase